MADENGLEIKVSTEQFDEIDSTDKKLSLIFQVVNVLQGEVRDQTKECSKTVAGFKNQFDRCDKIVDKAVNLPKRNRKLDLGVGAGTGTVSYVAIDKVIEIIKSYFSGG